MIRPERFDEGKQVAFVSYYVTNGDEIKVHKVEKGFIKSWTDRYVFVVYNGDTAAATRREDLFWLDQNGELPVEWFLEIPAGKKR